jgi:chromate transport protein ChrA
MTSTNIYQPGVCNIGPAEIRQRRRLGWIGLAVTVVFLVLAFAFNFPPPLRLLVALPAGMAATGFLQGAFHFCVRFGTQGLFNFGEIGAEEAVHETEYRTADQRKAVLIIVLSLAIAVVVALAALLV